MVFLRLVVLLFFLPSSTRGGETPPRQLPLLRARARAHQNHDRRDQNANAEPLLPPSLTSQRAQLEGVMKNDFLTSGDLLRRAAHRRIAIGLGRAEATDRRDLLALLVFGQELLLSLARGLSSYGFSTDPIVVVGAGILAEQADGVLLPRDAPQRRAGENVALAVKEFAKKLRTKLDARFGAATADPVPADAKPQIRWTPQFSNQLFNEFMPVDMSAKFPKLRQSGWERVLISAFREATGGFFVQEVKIVGGGDSQEAVLRVFDSESGDGAGAISFTVNIHDKTVTKVHFLQEEERHESCIIQRGMGVLSPDISQAYSAEAGPQRRSLWSCCRRLCPRRCCRKPRLPLVLQERTAEQGLRIGQETAPPNLRLDEALEGSPSWVWSTSGIKCCTTCLGSCSTSNTCLGACLGLCFSLDGRSFRLAKHRRMPSLRKYLESWWKKPGCGRPLSA